MIENRPLTKEDIVLGKLDYDELDNRGKPLFRVKKCVSLETMQSALQGLLDSYDHVNGDCDGQGCYMDEDGGYECPSHQTSRETIERITHWLGAILKEDKK